MDHFLVISPFDSVNDLLYALDGPFSSEEKAEKFIQQQLADNDFFKREDYYIHNLGPVKE